MKNKIILAFLGLSLALIAGPVDAQTEVGMRFGIRPTKAYEDRPETFSYFSYELEPGAVLADEALVMNSGSEPVTLTLYAADGFTAINTGTAFTKRGQEATGVTRGVNRWLFFSVTDIALDPGEEMLVPFTISVPADATPGQHVAGLVVEAPPKKDAVSTGGGGGQFGAIVVQQAGVAVVIDVPGPHFAGLEITGTCLKEQGDIGATFEIDVRSRGNIIVRGEGSLSIMDRNAEELATVPLKMGAVLPGDATTFQVTHPLHLADGDYLLSGVLNYEGRALDFEGKIAVLNELEMKVKDGQPDVGCHPEEEEEASPPFSIADIVPLAPSSEVGLWWYAGAAFLALILTLLSLITLLRRARRRQASKGAGKSPATSKVVPPQSSEDDGSDPPAGAREDPFSSKVVPPQNSEEDGGDVPAAGARTVPRRKAGMAKQRLSLEQQAERLLNRGSAAPTKAHDDADAPPPRPAPARRTEVSSFLDEEQKDELVT